MGVSGGSGDRDGGYRLPLRAGLDGRCSFMDPVFSPFATHYYRVVADGVRCVEGVQISTGNGLASGYCV